MLCSNHRVLIIVTMKVYFSLLQYPPHSRRYIFHPVFVTRLWLWKWTRVVRIHFICTLIWCTWSGSSALSRGASYSMLTSTASAVGIGTLWGLEVLHSGGIRLRGTSERCCFTWRALMIRGCRGPGQILIICMCTRGSTILLLLYKKELNFICHKI